MKYRIDLKTALIAAVLAAAINTGLYYLGVELGVIDTSLTVRPDGGGLTLSPVLVFSIAPVFLAWFVFLLIANISSEPIKWFSILAILFLVLSFGLPFSVEGIQMPMVLYLNLMHAVVAGIVLYLFRKQAFQK